MAVFFRTSARISVQVTTNIQRAQSVKIDQHVGPLQHTYRVIPTNFNPRPSPDRQTPQLRTLSRLLRLPPHQLYTAMHHTPPPQRLRYPPPCHYPRAR